MSAGCSGVHRLILRGAEDFPERIALVHPQGPAYGRISYGELAARVARVARGLERRGVGRGDRVVVLVPMSCDLYVSLLAVVSLGAVAVFVEPGSSARELARVVRLTRPRALIGIPKAHALRVLAADVARVPVQVVVGPRAAALLGATTLAALEDAEPSASLPEVTLRGHEPALLTFSSGTTGTPKGAVRSHDFLAAQHRAIERLLDRRPGADDVDLSAFAIVLLSSLAAGRTAVIPRLGRGGVSDVDGAAIVELIEREGVTVMSGSPAFLAPIAAAASRRPLIGLRRLVSGGAPVPLSLCDRAAQAFPAASFCVVYGSTEAEPIATIDAADVRGETAARTRAGAGLCVGRPDPHIALRLLRPTTAPLEVGPGGVAGLEVGFGEVGEVAVCGEHVNRGYYRNLEAERATKLVDEHGRIWHRTGDAGTLDEQGRLWIVGRVADIVRRGESVYYPAAVEAAAQSLPAVERAALVAGGGGETVLVVQRSRRLLGPGARAIRRHMAGAGVTVDRIEIVRRLPTDARHRAKLDYAAIRRAHGGVR